MIEYFRKLYHIGAVGPFWINRERAERLCREYTAKLVLGDTDWRFWYSMGVANLFGLEVRWRP